MLKMFGFETWYNLLFQKVWSTVIISFKRSKKNYCYDSNSSMQWICYANLWYDIWSLKPWVNFYLFFFLINWRGRSLTIFEYNQSTNSKVRFLSCFFIDFRFLNHFKCAVNKMFDFSKNNTEQRFTIFYNQLC